MALVICCVHRFALLRSAILRNCQRSDFRLQHIAGSVLDCRSDWLRMELAGRVHAVRGIIRFIETGGFGPVTRKSRIDTNATDTIPMDVRIISFFFVADGHNGLGARIDESIVGRISSNYAIHHIYHSLKWIRHHPSKRTN